MNLKAHRSLLAALIVFTLLFSACEADGGKSNPLIGKWEHHESASGVTVILEFTSDHLSFSAEGVNPAKTSYTYVDEDTIMVRNPDTNADVETSYSIQGDKLTIAFSGEGKVEFTRVK
jgi:hypothetical protein